MPTGDIIQTLDMWPRHHSRTGAHCYEGTHVIDPNGKGNGMVIRTIKHSAQLYEVLFERMMDTPVTGAEWNNYMKRAGISGNPVAVDTFDVWLHQTHPGYFVYMCQLSELTDIEQDAFDAYHETPQYGSRKDCLVMGLLGAYYNDPEATTCV